MPRHVSILLGESCDPLIAGAQSLLKRGMGPACLVDATFGGGGHTAYLLEKLKELQSAWPGLKLVGVDRDLHAIEAGRERFAEALNENRLELVHSRFASLLGHLSGRPLVGLLADFGISSDQLDDASRGLSFLGEGPLDMRMSQESGDPSAFDLLETLTQKQLETILWEYGEERFSRRIAASIIEARHRGELVNSTRDFAQRIIRALPAAHRHGRIHGATRSFQALRMAVNQELQEIEAFLAGPVIKLEPGARVAVLSFHSLEDRLVKQAFRDRKFFLSLTKKPARASDEEVAQNSRARSARLRVAERLL